MAQELKQVRTPEEALELAQKLEDETRYLAGKIDRSNEQWGK